MSGSEKKSEQEHKQQNFLWAKKKFRVVVAQNNGKEMYKKVCRRRKVAFLLIRPIYFLAVLVAVAV